MFKKIENIEAWTLARELAKEVWIASSQGSFAKDFALKDQINRSAGSIMDNIAEGYGRGGNKEFIHFLSIARASAQEVKSQLYRAYDRQHLHDALFKKLMTLCTNTIYKVHRLFITIQASESRGSKYRRGSTSDPNLQEPKITYEYE